MKRLSVIAVGLTLIASPSFATPATPGTTVQSGPVTFQATPMGGEQTLEILSGERVIATINLAPGASTIRADKMVYNSISKISTLTGHVLVLVAQNGQPLLRINAEKVRIGSQSPK